MLTSKKIWFLDDLHGFAAGLNVILRTIDGGETWQRVYTGGYHFSIYFTDPENGYVTGSLYNDSSSILKTTDGGLTWFRPFTVPPYYYSSVTFINDSTGYAVGQYGIIVKTTDRGQTWNIEMMVSCVTDLGSITFTEEGIGFTIGTDGAILTTGEIPVSVEKKAKRRLEKFYIHPNPATSMVNISYDSSLSEDVEITLCNLSGCTLTHIRQRANPAQLDIGKIAPGLYFLQIRTSSGIETHKLIVK